MEHSSMFLALVLAEGRPVGRLVPLAGLVLVFLWRANLATTKLGPRVACPVLLQVLLQALRLCNGVVYLLG